MEMNISRKEWKEVEKLKKNWKQNI
uniref:Uncharacterized protein n=1 Tax=Tetranychus urticae TaxID=32264 RepID=T1KUW0_TETUR